MLSSKIKLLIVILSWTLIGSMWYINTNRGELAGSDFPKPDPNKGIAIGWDFDKQEYRYHEPNPKTNDIVKPIKNYKPDTSSSEEDVYDILYYGLD